MSYQSAWTSPVEPSAPSTPDLALAQDSWHAIGQTSNQLILYHPPSHALSVRPHTPAASINATAGPSRLAARPPLLLPFRSEVEDQPRIRAESVDIASNNGTCPYCAQPLPPARAAPEAQTARTPYFRILEQAHEGSRPPSPRLRGLSPTPTGTPQPEEQEDEPGGDLPSRGYYERFFREDGKLGMGAEGSVFLATHIIGGNVLGTYAVKKIAVGESKDYLVRMLREVRLLESLRHPNIIPYHHAWIEPTRFSSLTPSFGPPINALHVLMLYATAGNLDTFLLNRSYGTQPTRPDLSAGGLADQDSLGQLPKAERIKAFKRRRASGVAGVSGKREETRGILFLGLDEVVRLFGDVVEGLAFLHSNSILHLDLKCSNVLLHWIDEDLIPRAMISDFGTSEEMLKGKRERSGHTGTMEYMAPETLTMGVRGEWRPSDSHADMWSTGMILYKMIFLHMPYSDVDDFDVLHAEILRYPGFIPTPEMFKACERRHIPRDMLVLLSRLINVDPESRPSADKVRMGLRSLKSTFPAAPRRGERGGGSVGVGVVSRMARPFVGLGEMVRGTSSNSTKTIGSPLRSTLALPPTTDMSEQPDSMPLGGAHETAHILDPIYDPSAASPSPSTGWVRSAFYGASRGAWTIVQTHLDGAVFALKLLSLHPAFMPPLMLAHVPAREGADRAGADWRRPDGAMPRWVVLALGLLAWSAMYPRALQLRGGGDGAGAGSGVWPRRWRGGGMGMWAVVAGVVHVAVLWSYIIGGGAAAAARASEKGRLLGGIEDGGLMAG